ncbi:MAG: NAD(P)/FAD-dependent oxidoreductase [Cyanobacteriota bacterium]
MNRSSLFRLLAKALKSSHLASPKSKSKINQLMSRRKVLQLSAFTAGLLTTSPLLSLAQGKMDPKIAIVGGGLAGLNAAYQLKKLGLSSTVYEAKSILGGRIQSQAVVELSLINDLGGCFVNSDHEDILELVQELNLELFPRFENLDVEGVPETAYFYNGRLYSEAQVAEQLQPLAEQIGQDAVLLEDDFDIHAERLDGLSVQEYLDQHSDKISSRWIRDLVETGIRSEYGVEPFESSALQLIYNLPTVEDDSVDPLTSDEAYTIQGGSAQLIAALADQLQGQIKSRWILRSLKEQGEKFQLIFEKQGGSLEEVEADYVILAIPFPALRRVDLQVKLPEALSRFIQEVNLGRNEKVFAGFQERVWLAETGFAIDLWSDAGFSQIWEDTQRQRTSQSGVLTFYLGGNEVSASTASSSVLGTQMLQQVETILPDLQSSKTERYHRTRWLEDPYIGGGYTSFKPGQYLEFSEYLYIESEDPDERVDVHVGSLIFAGEQFSDEYYGYMNGAAQTGRLAAEVVAGLIQKESYRTEIQPIYEGSPKAMGISP